jgi:hypothetical protein
MTRVSYRTILIVTVTINSRGRWVTCLLLPFYLYALSAAWVRVRQTLDDTLLTIPFRRI